MLVGEHTPAPRVVAGLRKLRPELTPGPVPTPADPSIRISGVLRQYYNDDDVSWAWVRAAVRGGCLLAWRDGTLPRRPAARLPLRHLHLRAATMLPNAFQLSRLRDDTSVATFQACNATEYARWVRALCVEILGQTPLPQVRFLDVLSATDTCIREPKKVSHQDTPSCPPRPPPRARRRLITAPETYVPRRDHSPAATDEGIVVEDDDYDSSSDRSLDLSLSLDALKNIDTVDAPVRKAEIVKCDNCSKLNSSPPQHHTLPRAARSESVLGPHRYLKRWEGSGGRSDRGRYAMEAAKRKAVSLENRARSCSPSTHEAVSQYIPVKERRALFESLSQSGGSLARSSEQLSRPIETEATPRRAASLHDLQAPPTRSVSDLRQFFEAVARGSTCSTLQRQIVPPSPVLILPPFTSLTCA